MQLLFEGSEEGDIDCLGLIEGRVRALEPAPGRPVPHMGWSKVEVAADDLGVRSGDYLYFAHGFACDTGQATVATASYGRDLPVIVRKSNWLGAQFHPERSGEAGTRFLEELPRMIIYPAMDLMGGRVVRLRQGRFDATTTYPQQPADALRGFAAAGARVGAYRRP